MQYHVRLAETQKGHLEGRGGLDEESFDRFEPLDAIVVVGGRCERCGQRTRVHRGHLQYTEPVGQCAPTDLVRAFESRLLRIGEVLGQRRGVVVCERLETFAHRLPPSWNLATTTSASSR